MGNKFVLKCNNSGVNDMLFCMTTNHNSRPSSRKYICEGSSLFVLIAMTGYKNEAKYGGTSDNAMIICN